MSGLAIGGSGIIGVGFEAVYGAFVPPTKFIPVRSESLALNEDKQWLTPIRGVAGRSGKKRGYTQIQGDISIEVTSIDVLYFLYAARTTPTKTGAGSPWTYNFVPSSVVLPTTGAGATTRKTLSIYVERGGEVFGYAGCSVTNQVYTIDNGNLVATFSILGLSEEEETVAVPTYVAYTPYGPGKVGVELPSGSVRTDVDTFSTTINDAGEPLNRVKLGGRGPSYIRWGEREVSGSFDHDFLNRDEYEAFTADTERAFRVIGENDAANDRFQLTFNNTSADSYPVNLAGLGDLVRASVDFHAYQKVGVAEYEIEVKSTESIT